MQKELDAMIDDLQLQEMTNTPSRNLSGGMKRKLRYLHDSNTLVRVH